MTRRQLDREFLGSEWEAGHYAGVCGFGWVHAVNRVRRALERDMTYRERLLFLDGWKKGLIERERREQEALTVAIASEDVSGAEIPF